MFPSADATATDIFSLHEGDRAQKQKEEDIASLSDILGFREAIFKVEDWSQEVRNNFDSAVESILKQMPDNMRTEITE